MVIDFTISNFRSIKEPQTISFEATDDKHLEQYYIIQKGKYRLLKIAALLGANASGKSNVLKAFMLFPTLILNPCENKDSIIKYKRFALDDICEKSDSTMIINFICGQQKYNYEVHFNNTSVTYELLKVEPFESGTRVRKVFERRTNPTTMYASVVLGDSYKSYAAKFKDLSLNLLHNRTVFGAFQKSNVEIPWLKEINDWVKSYWLPAVKTTDQHLSEYTTERIHEGEIQKNDVVNILKKADIGVNDLSISEKIETLPKSVIDYILNNENAPEELKKQVKEDPTTKDLVVKLAHNGKNGAVPFDFSEESRGTQRYYELSSVLLMIVKESHFLAIDELECQMHPDLYEHFITTYLNNSKESQLIYTTHMREFLSDRDLFRDDSVWFTEKNEEGVSEVFSLADFGTEILRQGNSRYNAYRSGRLGAIPRLGDTQL